MNNGFKTSLQPQNSFTGTEEHEVWTLNGWLGLLIILGLASFDALSLLSKLSSPKESVSFVMFLLQVAGGLGLLFSLTGLKIVQPNQAFSFTLFGDYAGTLSESGFYWTNPFMSPVSVSIRAQNMLTPVLKVNDGNGNPIEIAATIVWRVDSPAKALFDVENVNLFVKTQCESAVRALAALHPYENDEEGKISLRRHADEISTELRLKVQERVSRAGVVVDEARIAHLAYAPEIAQAMLRRQQAEAVVAARTKLVEGAVGMVDMALKKLESENIAKLDDKEKARLVTNMMTVLLSEEGASPVVSVGAASD